ncbi:MAG: Ig-like domain-containing protein [Nocardioides sp.]
MRPTRPVFGLLALGLTGAVLATSAPALAGTKPAATCKRCTTADTTAPVVAISSPTSGATVSGSTPVSGTASDAGGLAKVELQVDGGSWSTVTGTSSWSTSLGTTGLADGTHSLTARATDTSGNTASTSVSVTVSNPVPDTTAPTVSVASPTSGSTVAGAFTVSGTAADATSVAAVQVQVDGGAWQAASGTTSWSLPLDTTALANGSHSLTARATDPSGKSGTATAAFTVDNATSTSTDVVLTDPVAVNGLALLGRGRAASWGSVSAVLYWEESTSHRSAFFRDAQTGATSYVPLPVDNGNGWSNAAYTMTSATDLWVLGGAGPMSLRHFALSGSGLPTAATLLSDQVLGDTDSRQGDLIRLASGALLMTWHQQGVTGPQGQWLAYQSPGAAAPTVTGPLQFMPTKASKQVLVQNPADGSVWLFSDPDAWGAVGAVHLTETASGVTVDWTDPTYLDVTTYGDKGPDPENPDLAAAPDPSTGTVVLAYQSDARKTFSTSPTVVTGSYPVVARIPASGPPVFSQLPTYVERISSLGLVVQGGDVRLVYRPVDEATLTFDHVWTSVLHAGTWQPAVELGQMWTSYERISFSPSRMEAAVRMADGRLHLFLPA